MVFQVISDLGHGVILSTAISLNSKGSRSAKARSCSGTIGREERGLVGTGRMFSSGYQNASGRQVKINT